MPKKSQKQTFEEWEKLLDFVEENAAELPGEQDHGTELKGFHLRATIARQLRDSLAAAMVSASHRLKMTLAEGEAVAASLRSHLREILGVMGCDIPLRLRRRPPVDG
jgi:hypothetical protein